jgi:hypothetical protein
MNLGFESPPESITIKKHGSELYWQISKKSLIRISWKKL